MAVRLTDSPSVDSASGQGSAGAAPNIVVIQTDDQTVESMRVMKRTRRLIGRRGTTFTNHFASWPECCPSRVTLLTGQYAHNHGVLGNPKAEFGGFENFANQRNTLPVWLQQRDYVTAHLGKYVNGYGLGRAKRSIPPGWDRWYTGVSHTVQDVYGYVQNENGELVRYGARKRDFKQDLITRQAQRLIRRHARPDGSRGPPLYLQVDYTAPHLAGPQTRRQPPRRCERAAYPAPRDAKRFRNARMPRDPSFNERDVSDKPASIRALAPLGKDEIANSKRRYRCRLASLLSVDRGVGRIVRELREAGALQSSFVIFTSDNGYLLGEHRVPEGKALAYEPSIQVPLMVRGPGVEPGAKRSELTVNVDLGRTIARLAGADPGRVLDGRNLLSDPESGGRDVLIETNLYQGLRTEDWLWVEYENGERELYDMQADPKQLESMHDEPQTAAVRAELAARLDELRDCEGAECR
ncbi:MAG: sulfatase [Solirubrobacterales bacterium]|nr:sulfatase [Solirubrobacterales bacterium]